MAEIDKIDNHVSRLSSKKRPVVRQIVGMTIVACCALVVCALWLIWSSRKADIADSTVETANVARMVGVQVESALKEADLTLLNIVERIEHDGTSGDATDRLEVHLVELAKSTPEFHGLFVYADDGKWLATSLSRPLAGNNSDRAYFQYHRDHPSRSVHVDHPVRSKSTGVWVIPVSRRINNADGSFAGVALVTLRVNFFEKIYDKLDVGSSGTVLLALSDGTLVYRRPFEERLIGTNISNGPLMNEIRQHGPDGSAFLTAKIDRVERLYSYRKLQAFPFVVSVAQSKKELLAHWQRESLYIVAVIILICILLALLAKKLIRQILIRDRLDQKLRHLSGELHERNTDLEMLAQTDSLTSLANRRMFDKILASELDRAERQGSTLTLIMMDVDFFKKFNDHYGHIAGDECLRQVGRVLSQQVIRTGDLAARYGGEEFAVILPNTDEEGGLAVVHRIRSGILSLAMRHDCSPMKLVTASFGVTTIFADETANRDSASVIARADLNLYKAKTSGRDCVVACNSLLGDTEGKICQVLNAELELSCESELWVLDSTGQCNTLTSI